MKKYYNNKKSKVSRNAANKGSQTSKMLHLKSEIISDLKGVENNETMDKLYHIPLPPEIENWYVYTPDDGHSILVISNDLESEITEDRDSSYLDLLIPCPVKTVLRGYRVNEDGVIIAEHAGYSEEFGLIISDSSDYEFGLQDINPREGLFSISFEGQNITDNGFWDSEWNKNGIFYLVYNNRSFHLMIPAPQENLLREMKSGYYIVITTGYSIRDKATMIEIMFEDHSDNPFALSIATRQCHVSIDLSLDGYKFPFKAYTKDGLVFEKKVYVRSKGQVNLPWMKPIRPENYRDAYYKL